MGRFREKHERAKKKSMNFIQGLINTFKHSSSREGLTEDDLAKLAAQEHKLFKFPILVSATNNFHPSHKLGEGGFGPVYKGKLDDGREIAVKKLSLSSNQGNTEFINEAKLLARVQHRNIVNLLGYCVNGEDKLLVYEYVTHESLDKLLFKSNRRGELEWKRRFEIICGIARGLLYLHEGAPDMIIHRDIKASNILLDDKWVPKIADFGMARLFSEDQTHVNTRVAGTNGYMAPEYLMNGYLSTKADVYSFGVLVLELISGQKNSTFSLSLDEGSLLDWAYKLYKKDKSLDIMDPSLTASAEPDQVKMCVQIGLLCTQGDPHVRPQMQRITVLLARKSGHLEEPSRPGTPGSTYRRPRRPKPLTSSARTSDFSGTDPFDTSLVATVTGSASTPASVNHNQTVSALVIGNRRFDPHGKRPMRSY